MHSKNIHADATYKMTIQNYPILVFGTTDQDSVHYFHLLGIMVSRYERAEDFEFGFKTIRDTIAISFEHLFEPEALMSDAAGAIKNGFKAVYGEDKLDLTCFAHVMMAINKQSTNVVVQHDEIEISNQSVEAGIYAQLLISCYTNNGKKTFFTISLRGLDSTQFVYYLLFRAAIKKIIVSILKWPLYLH